MGSGFQSLGSPSYQVFFEICKNQHAPLCPVRRNIMSMDMLLRLIRPCDTLESAFTYKAMFLMAFFGFLCISNLAPHSYSQFDPSRHLNPFDIVFKKSTMTVSLKWSKIMQTRDKVYTIVLPKLGSSIFCPVNALKRALVAYTPGPNDPLFQILTGSGFQLVTESRLRKVLSKLNVKLGLDPHHFTFHTFRCSGATCAYNAHVPLQSIKSHGSWTSECV